MDGIVKTSYMDVPSANYSEYFCIDDGAREKIKPVPGDRAIMKDGSLYFCWTKGIWEKLENNTNNQSIKLNKIKKNTQYKYKLLNQKYNRSSLNDQNGYQLLQQKFIKINKEV